MRLTRSLPLNKGPRLLFVLVDSPKLRRHLANHLAAGLGAKGHTVATLSLSSPIQSPLQETFELAGRQPDAHSYFLLGLESSLGSPETRLNAIGDLNLHRDQIQRRLVAPLVIWTTDAAFTELLREAPDFAAWRAGVFSLADVSSATPAQLPSGVITAMFTDIVDSSRLKGLMPGATSRRRDVAFQATIKEPHDKLVRRVVEASEGRLINPTGDGFGFAFEDAEEAILCAVQIQEKLAAHPIQTPIGQLRLRIGLHTGIANPSGNEYIASTLDKAARVQSKAEGGQVLVSRETFALAVGKLRGVEFLKRGDFDLKGLGREELYQAFPSTADPATTAENAYRKHVIDRFWKVTLYSLTSDAPLAVDLEHVFVKLTATERRPTLPDGPAITRYGLSSPRSFTRSLVPGETTVTLSIGEALRSHLSLAIIGGPGAGKTTLLKYLALTFARHQAKERFELDEERLPIFVALRDFNRFLNNLAVRGELDNLGPALLPRFLHETLKSAAPHLALPSDFFARALHNRQCAVFLDGLDEVADSLDRSRAAEAVAGIARHFAGNRYIVTSRQRGYESEARQRLSPLCSECTLHDLDEAGRTAFALSWYTAVVTEREGDTPTARDKAAAAAADLVRAVHADTRIKALASNPLLLTVLAMVQQRGAALPQRRVELYEECCELLLGYWDQMRGGEAARELAGYGGVTRSEKRALLEPIALWLHERGESGLEVDAKDFKAEVARQFRSIFGDPEPQSHRRAELFLRVIMERTGLLVERETGVFAFSHLIFQEYLAARAIADREDYIEYTLRHLHDPWWHEVILLEVGHLATPNTRRSREQTTNILKAICNADSWLEDVLKRDLLISCRGLADVGTLGVDVQFRETMLNELFDLWKNTSYEPQLREVLTLLKYARTTPIGDSILDRFRECLAGPNYFTGQAIAKALGTIGEGTRDETLTKLLLPLLDYTDREVRKQAFLALGEIGAIQADTSVINILRVKLRDTDSETRRDAVLAIGRLHGHQVNNDVLEFLLMMLSDNDWLTRYAAEHAIRWADPAAKQQFLPALLRRLTENHLESLRSVVGMLGAIGEAACTERVVDSLVEVFQRGNVAIRAHVIECLGRISAANSFDKVENLLIGCLKEKDKTIRSAAFNSLLRSTSNRAGITVIEILQKRLNSRSVQTRRKAIKLLAEIRSSVGQQFVRDVLKEMLSDKSPKTLQVEAMQVLDWRGEEVFEREMLQPILDLAAAKQSVLRFSAIHTLHQLGTLVAERNVVALLVTKLSDRDPIVSEASAKALGCICRPKADREAVATILKGLNASGRAVRKSCALALVALGSAASYDEVKLELIRRLRRGNNEIRQLLAEALASLEGALADKAIIRKLVRFWLSQLRKHPGISAAYYIGPSTARNKAYDQLKFIASKCPRWANSDGSE